MTSALYDADPLVNELRECYPHLIAALATLPDGDQHLRRMVELDRAWIKQQFARQTPPIAVEHGEVSVPLDTPVYDIIYAGGGLNLINAAIMSRVYGKRVLVFDRFTVGAVHREWNISEAELQELVAAGAIDALELSQIIQQRYTEGLVHFHQADIQVPPADLLMRNVLDVAVDADALTACCIRHIQESPANTIAHGIAFERAIIGRDRVVVQAYDQTGTNHSFVAQLLIDGMGATSPIACQLNCGAPYSLVCPTVGTVASGYEMSAGREPGTIDPMLGEILITTEHAQDGHQLIWEAFPGKDGTVALYLFYYAETATETLSGKIAGIANSLPEQHEPSSMLLPLFEQFFTLLPTYKHGNAIEILKPVYGFIPAGYKAITLQRSVRKILATDRVLSLGDAAALQSPLTFCGFGSNTRNIRRITSLMAQALEHHRLRAADLRQINASETVPALSRSFSKFLIGKPENREPIYQVNETMNVFCRVLADMGDKPAREFFQDHIRWWDYTRLVLRTAIVYPRIFRLTARTLSQRDIATWIAAYAVFSASAARNTVGALLRATIGSAATGRHIMRQLWRRIPWLAWQLTTLAASVAQANRRPDTNII